MNKLIKQKELEILEIELKIKKLELEILKDCDFEMFLPIEGFDNYLISNFGNVKNSITNKILKLSIIDKGIKELILVKMENVKILEFIDW